MVLGVEGEEEFEEEDGEDARGLLRLLAVSAYLRTYATHARKEAGEGAWW